LTEAPQNVQNVRWSYFFFEIMTFEMVPLYFGFVGPWTRRNAGRVPHRPLRHDPDI